MSQVSLRQATINELSTMKDEGKMIRTQSPVIRQWPWENGLPLEDGLMADRLKATLADSEQEPAFVSMVLKFAGALDAYDREGFFEHSDRDFAWHFLGGSGHVNDVRRSLLNVNHWDGLATPSKMDFAVHVLLRYRLLDIMANVLGCEKHPKKQIMAQTSVTLPNRVEQLRTSLVNWPQCIERFQTYVTRQGSASVASTSSILSLSSSSSFSSSSSSSSLSTPNSSPELQVFQTGLMNLISAMRHTKDANFHKVMTNIQLLVFALCWFGMGELDFPKDDATFLEILFSKCTTFGVDISSQALQDLKEAAGSTHGIIKAIKLIFYLATSVSPLLVLIPKRYSAKTVAFRKEALTAYSMALGNEKPEFLARLEKSLWTSMVRMASGSPVMAEIHSFLAGYETLSQTFMGPRRHSDWFKTPLQIEAAPTTNIRPVSIAGSLPSTTHLIPASQRSKTVTKTAKGKARQRTVASSSDEDEPPVEDEVEIIGHIPREPAKRKTNPLILSPVEGSSQQAGPADQGHTQPRIEQEAHNEPTDLSLVSHPASYDQPVDMEIDLVEQESHPESHPADDDESVDMDVELVEQEHHPTDAGREGVPHIEDTTPSGIEMDLVMKPCDVEGDREMILEDKVIEDHRREEVDVNVVEDEHEGHEEDNSALTVLSEENDVDMDNVGIPRQDNVDIPGQDELQGNGDRYEGDGTLTEEEDVDVAGQDNVNVIGQDQIDPLGAQKSVRISRLLPERKKEMGQTATSKGLMTPKRQPKAKGKRKQSSFRDTDDTIDDRTGFIKFLPGLPMGKSTVLDQPEVKLVSMAPISIFGPDPTQPAFEYVFHCPEYTADDEFHLLSDIQASVERLYQNGIPLHHLSAARSTAYDPEDPTISSIFVVDAKTFREMDYKVIQDVFRHRHILVTGVITEKFEYDLQGLSTLGSPTIPRHIQVASLRSFSNPDDALHYGTLMDIYELSQRRDNPQVVNSLDWPMGDVSVDVPPNFRHLASHERAMQVTRGLPGLPHMNPQTDQMIWGTTALKHATSWPHIDDDGFGTVVTNVVGAKYWVVAKKRRDAPPDSQVSDMGTTQAFGLNLRPTSARIDECEHEAVVLTPGTVLFMRPTTPHYVLTLEHSITHGRHFYSGAALSDAVFGVVHTFILHYGVTNTLHESSTRTFLHRIMAMCHRHYDEESGESDYGGHVPDITSKEGLCDLMAVGNLCELGTILQREAYEQARDPTMVEETQCAARRYRHIQLYFNSKYSVMVNDKFICPFFIFRRSLVQFLAALVTYKTNMEDQINKVKGCSATVLTKRVKALLKAEYPELLPCWMDLVKQGWNSFGWTGPDFTIVNRDLDDDANELHDVYGWNIYGVQADEDQPTDIESEDEPEENGDETSLMIPGGGSGPQSMKRKLGNGSDDEDSDSGRPHKVRVGED